MDIAKSDAIAKEPLPPVRYGRQDIGESIKNGGRVSTQDTLKRKCSGGYNPDYDPLLEIGRDLGSGKHGLVYELDQTCTLIRCIERHMFEAI